MHEYVSKFEHPGFCVQSKRRQSLYFIILCLAPRELDHPLFSPPPPYELKPNSAHAKEAITVCVGIFLNYDLRILVVISD